MFFKWPFGICTLQLATGILAAVATFTDYWGVVDSNHHFGLVHECTTSGCFKNILTDDVINLFMAVFALGLMVSLPFSVLELVKDLGWNLFYCGVSGLMALLAFAAVIHSIVLFSSIQIPFTYSWSFGLGWLTVIAAVAIGVLSFFTREKTQADGSAAISPSLAFSTAIVAISRNVH